MISLGRWLGGFFGAAALCGALLFGALLFGAGACADTCDELQATCDECGNANQRASCERTVDSDDADLCELNVDSFKHFGCSSWCARAADLCKRCEIRIEDCDARFGEASSEFCERAVHIYEQSCPVAQ